MAKILLGLLLVEPVTSTYGPHIYDWSLACLPDIMIRIRNEGSRGICGCCPGEGLPDFVCELRGPNLVNVEAS
ncbi:hypothetical protein B0H19DRAFT_1169496 [Mycena capillaripes]|nr:hypothetical protein B0H19DRAFT_1169496 [Mycena capillaripes]